MELILGLLLGYASFYTDYSDNAYIYFYVYIACTLVYIITIIFSKKEYCSMQKSMVYTTKIPLLITSIYTIIKIIAVIYIGIFILEKILK